MPYITGLGIELVGGHPSALPAQALGEGHGGRHPGGSRGGSGRRARRPWTAVRIPGNPFWTSKKELARLAAPFLEPGEEIRHLLIGYRSMLEPHWALVVTDRAILVLDPGAVRPGFSRWLRGRGARRLPRSTRLGPVFGQGWILVEGERMFVPMGKQAISAIDAEAGFPTT